jgi:NAD(P)-dependent dehydrogenase (short-subunit alcohol dehydrogenase family)
LGQSHRLLIADRDAAHLEARVASMVAAGHDARGHRCDVTNADDIAALASAAANLGGARALAYVVGLSPSLGDFASIISVNIVGAARALSLFREVIVPGGAALCVSSSAAHMQDAPGELLELLDDPLQADLVAKLVANLGEDATPATAYTLSKKALVRLCQREAAAWGLEGKRTVSLSPGLIATPQGALEFRNSPGKMQLFEAIPLGRECTMLEIAGVAEFLLSDRASYVNGVDLLVDGGLIGRLGTRRLG